MKLASRFASDNREVAQRSSVHSIFTLSSHQGVASDPKLNQPDGLHPTAAGVEIIVQKILPAVEALLKQVNR